MIRLALLLIVFALGFAVAAVVGAHANRGAHTSVVLWSCGPGVELNGSPRLFFEQCK